MGISNNEIDAEWFRVPLLAIVLFETAALIARSYFQVRLRNGGYETNLAADLSYLVVPPILLILMYPVLRKHGSLLFSLFPPQFFSPRLVVTGVVLGLVLRLTSWCSKIAMNAPDHLPGADQLHLVGMLPAWSCPPVEHILLGVLVSAMLIPVIEECLNRGFLMHRLLKRGRILAVIASSFLFAVYHDPGMIIPAFGVGVILSIATLNSGSLWLACVAHASYNFSVQIDGRCLTIHWSPMADTTNTAVVVICATFLAFLGLLCASLLVSPRVIGAPSAPQ